MNELIKESHNYVDINTEIRIVCNENTNFLSIDDCKEQNVFILPIHFAVLFLFICTDWETNK